MADWGVGCVQAQATSGRVEARPAIVSSQEARKRAVEALSEGVRGIVVDADHTVGDVLAADSGAADRLEGAIRSAEIMAEWFEDAGNVTAVAALRLFGPAPSLLSSLGPALGVSGGSPPPTSGKGPSIPTGKTAVLVVDARRTDLVPALFPKVLQPDGQPLRFPSLKQDSAADRPPFWYVRSYEEARRLVQKGEWVLAHAATGRGGRWGCDPVLGQQDVEDLRGPERADFARVARIIIVY